MAFDDIIMDFVEEVNSFSQKTNEPLISLGEIKTRLPSNISTENNIQLVTAKIQRIILQFLNEKLEENPSFNQKFSTQTSWPILNKLLTLARLKELSNIKIVKKGSRSGVRYYITEMMDTYYGKQILMHLDFSKQRKVASQGEFNKIIQECQKIKLELPEVIEPTRTEHFFSKDSNE
ncbi:MAG: hypothetical protein ACFFB5_22605 [Promethearchaeota archaeon]